MTKLLRDTIKQVEQLPEGEQDAAAVAMLDYLATVKDAEHEIREAIRFHIDGLKEDGQPVPQPTSIADYVEA